MKRSNLFWLLSMLYIITGLTMKYFASFEYAIIFLLATITGGIVTYLISTDQKP